jgi:hypothetical protein
MYYPNICLVGLGKTTKLAARGGIQDALQIIQMEVEVRVNILPPSTESMGKPGKEPAKPRGNMNLSTKS